MKLFTALQVKWEEFRDASSKYISSLLGGDGQYGSSNIFGQFLTVLNGAVQNLFLYIEDAFTEQNVHTANRKKSIYSLARLSGYNPSLGSAAKCSARLIYNSRSGIDMDSVVVPNRTPIISKQNGLTYNIILPQESCIFDIKKNNSIKHVVIVEGAFEKRSFVAEGGELYTHNVNFGGDIDLEFFTVDVNGERWERVEGLYDMLPDGKQYYIQIGMNSGVDLIFGNGQYGKILQDGDVIDIEYLTHNGEQGNIRPDEDITFIFDSSLTNMQGDDIDGNSYFTIELEDRSGIYNGAYSETTEHVKKMIGYNSRSLVFADAKNYKLFIDRFSFVGYNRCWSEKGSLIINAMVIKNYNQLYDNYIDYFSSLSEKDFLLTDSQKSTIADAVINSGQQIGGTVLHFVDPVIKKYTSFVYVKMKDGVNYYKDLITNQIKEIVGEIFSNIGDTYITKADIIQRIKNDIPQIDSVDLYFISEANEMAKHDGMYKDTRLVYDPTNMTYRSMDVVYAVPAGTDPHLGLDEHGNIYLDNELHFPALMSGWSYWVGGTEVTVTDPIQIIFR